MKVLIQEGAHFSQVELPDETDLPEDLWAYRLLIYTHILANPESVTWECSQCKQWLNKTHKMLNDDMIKYLGGY